MSNIVTTLRNKDIVEYIGGLELGSSGIWRCACPIHKGNNESSFAVFPSHSFYCFSCGAHGQDIISYVMQRDGIPFDVAVRQLADEYGLVIDSDDGYIQQKDLADRNKIWARSMMKSVDAVRNYLHTRGFNDEAIKRYCFGWSSKQHCLSIPFFDTYSRCVGFCYRFFEGKSKYKNSKNNELFEKGSFLYNEHIAMKMIHKTKTLYLVEGCFDSCSGIEQGLATVAYCGITLGKAHVQEIKRMFSTIKGAKVICVPDADGKANKFVSRARVLFKELFPECVVKVAEINPEQGKDFNDLFAKGINIEETITLKGIDLYCAEQVLLESKDKEVQEKLIVDFMRTISNPISKQDIATMLSEVWDRDVGLVRQLLDVKENTIDEKLLDIYSVSSAYESLDKMEEGEQIKTGWFNIDEAISMIKTDVCLLGAYSFAGKCVSKGTLISTSSGVVPIEDIKQGDEVVTLNEGTGKLEFDKVSKLINSGIKKGYKVTTRTGQTVTVSKEHPFLTPNGWMRIEDGLSVGGQIGLPSYIPQKTTKTIPIGYAIMEDVFFDEIVAIEEIEDVQMYDIAMPKNHNFVANNIILHNTSCLCQMMLDWTIVQQKRVLFFSLEMPKQRVMQTLVAMICQIPRHKVLGYIHEHPETAQLIEEKLADRLHIIDRNDITIDGVEDYLRLVNVHKGQVDIVCVDYFGYLQGTDDVEGQESTAKKMKAIAKRNNILFVMLTQFNKASQLKDGTKFHEPTMNDIKGAGGQGASADTILLLWKADSDTSLSPIDREKLRNISYIKIGKCRESKNGNTLFQMKYNPETSLVEEYIGENFLKGK